MRGDPGTLVAPYLAGGLLFGLKSSRQIVLAAEWLGPTIESQAWRSRSGLWNPYARGAPPDTFPGDYSGFPIGDGKDHPEYAGLTWHLLSGYKHWPASGLDFYGLNLTYGLAAPLPTASAFWCPVASSSNLIRVPVPPDLPLGFDDGFAGTAIVAPSGDLWLFTVTVVPANRDEAVAVYGNVATRTFTQTAILDWPKPGTLVRTPHVGTEMRDGTLRIKFY